MLLRGPVRERGFDTEIHFWARITLPEGDLESEPSEVVRRFISSGWPFGDVAYPDRDITWEEYEAYTTTNYSAGI